MFGRPVSLSAEVTVSLGSFLLTHKCGFFLDCEFCISDLLVFGCTLRGISALSLCFILFIPVFTVVTVQFYCLQYQLQFQWTFDKFFSGFLVVDGRSIFISDDIFGCDIVEFTFSFDVYQPFPYSSNISPYSCLILKKWALLWKTFLVGKNVFLNNLKSSCRLISFSSFLH